MAKVLQPFTNREYASYDDEGNRTVVSESDAFDKDGNLKEGVSPENVIYPAGSDFEGHGSVGFVEDVAPADDEGKPALKADK